VVAAVLGLGVALAGVPLPGAARDANEPGQTACLALAALALDDTTLTTEYAESRPVGPPDGAAMPAHCIVRRVMDPRTGVDGRHYETRFELRLPTDWSGRFLYQGGGGNDGIVRPAVGANTGQFPTTGLERGFAVVSTDAGHQGATPEFGLDPEARSDHAYRAHDRTATTAKALIARYYGRGPDYSYFAGCSGGGRQGMMFAQRFPEYFDGIVVCAPAMSVSSGATIAAVWDTLTYLSIAPADDDGQPVLSQALTPEDLAVVAEGILDACDADDGVVDGMVQRPEACRFEPAALACDEDRSTACLTGEEAEALVEAFAGPSDSSGQPLYVGQPWDPGIASPAWRQWKLGTSETATPNALNATLMTGALAWEFFTPPDPSFDARDFDFDEDPARMEAFSEIYDTFRDARLAPFQSAGGKLLLFHGTADGIFSAFESIDYYRGLAGNNGGFEATAAWARLFLVPGMNHCAGGPATDSFDGLAAIVGWVEDGETPERVPASAPPSSPYFAGRSRPLCPYPAFARYDGEGDVERAESFSCVMP